MSAWAQLVNSDGSDEHLELCNQALIEIQTEHARRLAEKIRDELFDSYGGFHDGVHAAADLIDPKEK